MKLGQITQLSRTKNSKLVARLDSKSKCVQEALVVWNGSNVFALGHLVCFIKHHTYVFDTFNEVGVSDLENWFIFTKHYISDSVQEVQKLYYNT